MAEQVGQSKNQIQRFIRLTELIPELLNMVDERKIALNPAYALSFLKKEEQTQLLNVIDSEQATPSLLRTTACYRPSHVLRSWNHFPSRDHKGQCFGFMQENI